MEYLIEPDVEVIISKLEIYEILLNINHLLMFFALIIVIRFAYYILRIFF